MMSRGVSTDVAAIKFRTNFRNWQETKENTEANHTEVISEIKYLKVDNLLIAEVKNRNGCENAGILTVIFAKIDQ